MPPPPSHALRAPARPVGAVDGGGDLEQVRREQSGDPQVPRFEQEQVEIRGGKGIPEETSEPSE